MANQIVLQGGITLYCQIIKDDYESNQWYEGRFNTGYHDEQDGYFQFLAGGVEDLLLHSNNIGLQPHPNIAWSVGIGAVKHTHFMSVFCVSRPICSLEKWLRDLEESESYTGQQKIHSQIKHVISQIIAGVQHVHERGMCGISLCPGDIFMHDDDIPKLTKIHRNGDDFLSSGVRMDYENLKTLISSILGVHLSLRVDVVQFFSYFEFEENLAPLNKAMIATHPSFWNNNKISEYILRVHIIESLADDVYFQLQQAFEDIAQDVNNRVSWFRLTSHSLFFATSYRAFNYNDTIKDFFYFCRCCMLHRKKITDEMNSSGSTQVNVPPVEMIVDDLYERFSGLFIMLHAKLTEMGVPMDDMK